MKIPKRISRYLHQKSLVKLREVRRVIQKSNISISTSKEEGTWIS